MVESLLTNWDFLMPGALLLVVITFVLTRRKYQTVLLDYKVKNLALSNQIQSLEDSLGLLKELGESANEELSEYRANSIDLSKRNARLEVLIEEREKAIRQQKELFESQKKSLQAEFEALANRIFDEKGKRFSEYNRESIEGMLKPFREQITEFRTRVDGIHKESNESAGSLKKELEYLRNLNVQMSEDAKNLTTALKGDKKALGNWGEVQLEKSLQLAGLVKGQHYRSQVHLKDDNGSAYFLDYLIELPDNQHLIIDSKASLLAYEAAISAQDQSARNKSMEEYVQALRNHVKDLSQKNYSRLKGVKSPNFVLMFLPLEAAYIEGLKHSPGLYEEAYRKNIILVSHTTLMPILKTVSNIWRLQNSQDDALALGEKAGDIYNQVCLVAERLQKLGGSMQSSSKHFNNVLVALAGQQGLHGKVERFKELSIEANRNMPQLDSLHTDFELERVERVLTDRMPGN
jgi:DNA recombination protein RmuC